MPGRDIDIIAGLKELGAALRDEMAQTRVLSPNERETLKRRMQEHVDAMPRQEFKDFAALKEGPVGQAVCHYIIDKKLRSDPAKVDVLVSRILLGFSAFGTTDPAVLDFVKRSVEENPLRDDEVRLLEKRGLSAPFLMPLTLTFGQKDSIEDILRDLRFSKNEATNHGRKIAGLIFSEVNKIAPAKSA